MEIAHEGIGRTLAVVWTKPCKKCSGDLYLESDRYGAYIACIQCGYVAAEVRNVPAAARQLVQTAEQMERVARIAS